MTILQQVLTVAAVVLGTMTTRFLPFLLFPEGKQPPAFIRYLGTVLPSAVIGLLVVFCLKDAVFTSWHGLPELLGIKIFPSVIEECLLQEDQVEACAVVGGRNSRGETVPVAHIVPQPGTDQETLERALRLRAKQALNTYLIPGMYCFWSRLPYTERGKLDYRKLEESQNTKP